jgi:hypothetical protein
MPVPVIPAAAELRIDLAADEARDDVLPFPFNLVEGSLLPLLSLAAERELFSDWFAVPVALEQVR